jgi:hypothetical protein
MALVRRIGLSTGTVWLDLTPEMFWSAANEVEWSDANITWLAREWKLAQAIDTAVADVWEWLEAEPPHMVTFVRLWNEALVPFTDEELHRQEMGSYKTEFGGVTDDEVGH